MSGDLVQLAIDATPYITAAASSYGTAVLTRTQEELSDATVGYGRRLAQKIFGVRTGDDQVPEVLTDVIDDPGDTDKVASLRLTICKALAADADLAEHVARLVEQARGASAQVMSFGERSPAVHTNKGIIATGDKNIFDQRPQ